MKETLRDIKERYAGEYDDIEVYEPKSYGKHYPNRFHTDNCTSTEEYSDDSWCGLVELMDEDEYNRTILANCGVQADFAEWYDDKNAKVLVVMLASPERED